MKKSKVTVTRTAAELAKALELPAVAGRPLFRLASLRP